VANLDATEATPTDPWAVDDPANTSNFSTTMTVYDDLGGAHTLDIYFRKTADNTWDWYGLVAGDDTADPAAAGTNVQVGTGTLTFNNDPTAATVGALDGVSANTVSVNFAGIASAQTITVNFGTSLADGGTGLDGVSQFASPENVSSQTQDGYASGDFSGITIDGEGVVMGLYTNGQKLALSQMAIAKFRSNDGLGRAGQSLWIDTRDSGSAAYGTAGSGGRGSTSSGSLEASNVDLAEEFVGLIQHQRSFSANSKTITTADEMLQELINIKR
jgi:flagellar hook protein FlgE